MSPDILAKKRSGTKEGEIAAMGLFSDIQLQFRIVEPSEATRGELPTDNWVLRSTRVQKVKDQRQYFLRIIYMESVNIVYYSYTGLDSL